MEREDKAAMGPAAQKQAWLDEGTAFLIAIVVAMGVIFFAAVSVTWKRQLTPLEQVLFQFAMIGLTFWFSWILAKRGEGRNILEKQKSLGRMAVRRIRNLSASTSRLQGNIDRCKAEISRDSRWKQVDDARRGLLLEFFEGLTGQTAEIRDSIGASVEDWRDILAEEFAREAEVQRRVLEEREKALQEQEALISKLRDELAKGEQRTAEQMADMRKLFQEEVRNIQERFNVRLEQIRAERSAVSPYFGPPTGLLSGRSPYLISRPSEIRFELPEVDPLKPFGIDTKTIDDIFKVVPGKLDLPEVSPAREATPGATVEKSKKEDEHSKEGAEGNTSHQE